MNSPEPRFARIAAMIGDPTRARMLSALMGGGYLAAGELAVAAGVTAATASSHIAQLVDNELVVARSQGRHRYFRLADADIAHALEALSLVAERSAAADKWAHGDYKPLKLARTCYHHLAGELGVALFDGLLARGSLRSEAGQLRLTDEGRAELAGLGVVLPEAPGSRGDAAAHRYAYACLDWSERRDHLAGSLATALLAHSVAAGWLRRVPGSRALNLSPAGAQALAPWLTAGRAAPASAAAPAGPADRAPSLA